MINSTRSGRQTPKNTHKFGVALQSLNKQSAIPTIALIITARVPYPIPPTSPLYISGLPVSERGIVLFV